MISKTKIAYIRSLHNSSLRHEEWVFLVEWRKSMNEFIWSDFEIVEWFLTEDFLKDAALDFPISLVSWSELSRMTTLKSNDSGLLLVKMKDNNIKKTSPDDLVIVLDGINDPGNLWTIIRIADWYGISHIVASEDTVDCYNQKVIMATMGSFSRVPVLYTNIDWYLSEITGKVYWAYLEGENIHHTSFTAEWAHIVIWNEAHGIGKKLEKYITHKLTIPRFGHAESLNAWVATAIIVDRIRWS